MEWKRRSRILCLVLVAALLFSHCFFHEPVGVPEWAQGDAGTWKAVRELPLTGRNDSQIIASSNAQSMGAYVVRENRGAELRTAELHTNGKGLQRLLPSLLACMALLVLFLFLIRKRGEKRRSFPQSIHQLVISYIHWKDGAKEDFLTRQNETTLITGGRTYGRKYYCWRFDRIGRGCHCTYDVVG